MRDGERRVEESERKGGSRLGKEEKKLHEGRRIEQRECLSTSGGENGREKRLEERVRGTDCW